MLKRLLKSRIGQTVKAYGQSNASNYANGLALTAFLAMFPLILGLLSIVGLVVSNPSVEGKIYASVAAVFPSDAHTEILKALQGVKHSAGLLGVVSIVGLIWSGTSLFASMEFALTEIYESKQRDMLRQRAMGLIMMVVFLIAILATVVVNSAAAVSAGAGILGAVAGGVIMFALLVAIYRFVPNQTFATREAVPGAILAGVLIEVFSLLFPLYAKVTHGFSTYGQQFALFFVLATWLTFMCQFILAGAVFNKVRLGKPANRGIVATPSSQARESKAPAEAIKEQKGEAELQGHHVR